MSYEVGRQPVDREPCRECGGMGYKTIDIIVGGTDHDTEDIPCRRCELTEGFEPAPAPAVSGQTPTGLRELIAVLVVQLRADAEGMTDFTQQWHGEESKIYGSAKASGYRYIATKLETILASSAPVASAPKDETTCTSSTSAGNAPAVTPTSSNRAGANSVAIDGTEASLTSPRTVTRYHFETGSPEGGDFYLASEVDPLLTALAQHEMDRATALAILDTQSGDDLCDACRQVKQVAISEADNSDKALAALAERAQEIERLRHHSYLMEQAAGQQHGPCLAQIESGLARIQTLTARAEAAEATVAHLTAQLEGKG